jgi:hypothetical protein
MFTLEVADEYLFASCHLKLDPFQLSFRKSLISQGFALEFEIGSIFKHAFAKKASHRWQKGMCFALAIQVEVLFVQVNIDFVSLLLLLC